MTKHRSHKSLLLLLAIIAVASALFTATGAKPGSWDVEARMRKADYTFLQGASHVAADSNDAAMRLYARAAALNPADLDIAAEKAVALLSLTSPDSLHTALAYEAMLRRFMANPTDYTGGSLTAHVARVLGRLDDMIEIWSTLDRLYPAKTDPAINLANAYVLRYLTDTDTTDFNAALNIFNRIERGTGKDIGLSSQKIRAYALRQDTMAITHELNELIDARPTEVEPYLLSGEIYHTFGLDSLALLNFRRACQVDSTSGRANVALAEVYHELGDSVAYDKQVFRALRSPDLEVDAKFQLLRNYVSMLYTDSTQWDRIDELFNILEQVNPGEPRIHGLYGAFKSQTGKHADALEQFSYSLALEPDNDDTRALVLQLLMRADSLNTLIDVAREGMEISPTNFYFPIMGAAALQQQKRYTEAIDMLTGVDIKDVVNKRAVSNLLTSLGDIYYQADMPDSAFAVYGRAINLDSENYMACNNYAYFLAERGENLQLAKELARTAVLGMPESSTMLDTYAWVYFKLKDYAEAKTQIDRALAACHHPSMIPEAAYDTLFIDPDSIDFDNLPDIAILPDSIEIDEYIVEAEDDYDEISADVLEHAGDIYFMNGDPDQALEFWKEALALKPDDELLARKVKHKTYFYK